MATPNHLPTDLVPEYTKELLLPGLGSVDTLYTGALNSLVQTEDYSRAYILSVNAARSWSPEQIDEAVERRHERTRALLGNTAAQKTIVIQEATLRIQVGSPAVMAAAAHHVLEMFDQPPERTSLYLVPERIIPGTEELRGAYDDYHITRSAEHGQRVWVADGGLIAPLGSSADLEAPVFHANLVQAAAPHKQAMNLLAYHAQEWERAT